MSHTRIWLSAALWQCWPPVGPMAFPNDPNQGVPPASPSRSMPARGFPAEIEDRHLPR